MCTGLFYQRLSRLNVILLITVTLSTPAVAQTDDDQKKILELEKQRGYAITLRDEAALSALLDDDYYGVTASGAVIHKTEQLALYKSTNPYVTTSSEEVVATVYGNTAVVTGILISKSKAGSVIGQTRYVYVYLKSQEKWKIKMGQETVVIK